MNQDASAISMPVVKSVTAIGSAVAAKTDVAGSVASVAVESASAQTWILVHSIPWSTLASIAAFVYTLALLSEWAWKRIIRPFMERVGWCKPRRVPVLSPSQWADLRPHE